MCIIMDYTQSCGMKPFKYFLPAFEYESIRSEIVYQGTFFETDIKAIRRLIFFPPLPETNLLLNVRIVDDAIDTALLSHIAVME